MTYASSEAMAPPPFYLPDDFFEQVDYAVTAPMIAWLVQGRPLHVLDAGCGGGVPALIFAAHGCTVTGVDVDGESVQKAQALFAASPFAARLAAHHADVMQLPFPDHRFDLVWASYSLHHIADKSAAVRELRRVLKPGGVLAIREGGLPLQVLPFELGIGTPGLQERLRVAQNMWFVRMLQVTLPDAVPYPFGWVQLLRDAGFSAIQARTFTQDFLPPFTPAQAAFTLYHLQRAQRWDQGDYGPLLSEEDRATVRALLDPAGPHYLLHRQDLHVTYGLSVYRGEKHVH